MVEYYKIRGKDLYTEILGEDSSPVLLFIHGGPGGIGVADFIQYQGDRLSKNFKVIAPDQRGVWRSEAILDEEHISLEDIIEDFEELRKKLHINKWSLLSHSFGGYLAVLYANLYPNSIEYMLYECPSFSFALSERSMLNEAAKELVKLGNLALAEDYFKALREITDYRDINKLLMKVLNELGANGSNYMWFGSDKQIIERIAMSTNDAKNLWNKSTKTRIKLLKDWRVYNDVFTELSNVNKPSLLIKGKYDPITCEVQTAEFMKRVQDKQVVIFDFSGHYTRIEEPDKYCEVITSYIYNKMK
ncbi:alpha/beta fold hydrolase [Clostridium estertheticum]|uniref:Proline iminopeptidase n=1 Tax=Clostridium estertheticum subsp. estertheticum TaxID=1552 RepID=A0A1J0GHT5_9CLOT|nr:alpha/beta hydrolase [Clostridium estertheticum]APC40839.1 proline iminopeptidase [Clostridium estertheticum subsp. estertheticum]MBZ9617304.1 alpha/beta hydrolase [Clostridium estertheticum subsp. laramiense]WAG72993.1 alpha/beta hydrolase [Clostridium estertheticum]